MSYPERFDGYERHCHTKVGDAEMVEQTYELRDGSTVTEEVERFPRCDTVLTFEENYVGMRYMDDYEGKVHALSCPECNAVHGVCPVCTDEDGGPGWFRGESTGEMLACHCCNAREAARQRRSPY